MIISLPSMLLACSLFLPQESGLDQAQLKRHVDALTSEAFGGRSMGSPGSQLAMDYLLAELKALGLQGGGKPDAEGQPSFEQKFTMQRYEHKIDPKLILTKVSGGEDVALLGRDFTINPHGLLQGTKKLEIYRFKEASSPISVASPERALHFAISSGFRNRVLLEGGFLEPGMWGLEIRSQAASSLGMIVGRPPIRFEQKAPSAEIERFDMVTLLGSMAGDLDWLGYSHVQLIADEQHAELSLSNLIAVLPGSNPELAGESILLQAFYDHGAVAVAPDKELDRGNHDAGSLAAMLEVARVLSQGPAPERSVVFLFSVGHSQRSIGISKYLKRPARPLAKIAGALSLVRLGVPLSKQRAPAGGVPLSKFNNSPLGAAAVAAGLPLIEGRPNKAHLMQAARVMDKAGVRVQIMGVAASHAPGELQNMRHVPTDYDQLESAAVGLLGAVRLMGTAAYQPAPLEKVKRRRRGQ